MTQNKFSWLEVRQKVNNIINDVVKPFSQTELSRGRVEE